MSQIFRRRRTNLYVLPRYYGNQRKLNHYETLRIPSNSTQKEIRDAFIKLSKQMHPDATGKSNHEEFVKINEAYSVLSKENSRWQYDLDMKNRNRMPSANDIYAYRQYRNIYEEEKMWNDYMSKRYGFPERNYEYKPLKKYSNVVLAIVCLVVSAVGLALQFLAVERSLTLKRDMMLKRSTMYAEEWNKVKKANENKAPDEVVKIFEQQYKEHRKELESLSR